MADAPGKPGDKKEEKKETPFWHGLIGSFDAVEWGILGVILFVVAIRVENFFAGSLTGGAASQFTTWLADRPGVTVIINTARVWLAQSYRSFTAFSAGFSVLMVVAICYISLRLYEVRKEWRAKLYLQAPVPQGVSVTPNLHEVSTVPANLPTGLPTGFRNFTEPTREPNPRWKQVLAHIGSDNPSDWRLAILEADIVLEETLDRAGYIGETLGDKLKSAEHRPFGSLNAAWEAHKIRNAIAHQGQGFELTQREAERVIGIFEAIFREFGAV